MARRQAPAGGRRPGAVTRPIILFHSLGDARAAVAAGVDGIFAEVHVDPKSSPSDPDNMLTLEELGPLLETLLEIHAIVNK